MSEINITLPDKSVKVLPKGVTPQEVANSIGSGLARAVVVAKIDGELKDLNYSLVEDCTLELFTGDSPEGHDTLLHSTAHLMAQAVKSLFPKSKVTIGPTIENGFYYDFDVETSFTDEIILKIEKRMKELAKSSQEISRIEISAKDAIKMFDDMGESYKVETVSYTHLTLPTKRIV